MKCHERGAIRVLVADDDPLARETLRRLVEEDDGLRVVAETRDGAETVEVAVRVRPDVAVLDVRMPRLTGVQAARIMRERLPSTGLVVVTGWDPEAHRAELVPIGVSLCVSKLAALDGLPRLVRDAHAAVSAPRPPVPPHRDGRPTQRQIDVLRLLASGASNREIAAELCTTVRTVESHLTALYRTTGCRGRVQLVRAVERAGWLA